MWTFLVGMLSLLLQTGSVRFTVAAEAFGSCLSNSIKLILNCFSSEEILLSIFSSCAWQCCFTLDIRVAYRQVKGCGYRARSSWDLLPAGIQCDVMPKCFALACNMIDYFWRAVHQVYIYIYTDFYELFSIWHLIRSYAMLYMNFIVYMFAIVLQFKSGARIFGHLGNVCFGCTVAMFDHVGPRSWCFSWFWLVPPCSASRRTSNGVLLDQWLWRRLSMFEHHGRLACLPEVGSMTGIHVGFVEV